MDSYDVVVIGAGAAGLSAARTLRQAGKRVLVLEAQDYIGGRVRTSRERGVVEAGAEFIHGEHAATWDLVCEMGIETSEWLPPEGGRDFKWKYATEGQLCELSEADQIDASWSAAYAYEGKDQSLAEYMPSQPYSSFVQEFTKERLARLESAPPDELSVREVAIADRQATNGHRNFWMPEGYDRLMDYLAREIDIKLKHPVTHISWHERSVTIECENGLVVEANQVVITVPLGVLQKGSITFSPSLPESFTNAMSRIGYGSVSKPTFWIEGKIEPFQLLATRHPLNFWQRNWGEETVLVGFTGYIFSRELAQMSEEEAVATVLPMVQDALGTDVTKRIRHARHFSWADNPYILGGYSYPKVGMGDARTELQTPIADTVFYAGEATNDRGHASTVHGAIEEGVSVAERILKA